MAGSHLLTSGVHTPAPSKRLREARIDPRTVQELSKVPLRKFRDKAIQPLCILIQKHHLLLFAGKLKSCLL